MRGSPVIAYCGMTHLGLVSGTAAAAKGFDTILFDPDADLIARLRGRDLVGRLQGVELPVSEPDLAETYAANQDRIAVTADAADLARADLVYLAPDVPTDDTGASDLSAVERLLALVAPAIRDDAVLVILSQAPPGFTRAIPSIRGPLYYQVETLVFGIALQRALEPERFIVGSAEPEAPLPAALQTYLDAFGCPVLPMRYESAELAKISINMCLVASIGVANTMAELCEHVGADWAEIAPALKLDRRIGAYSYLGPGLGLAGGNLERDLATVIRLGAEHGTDTGIVTAWMENSVWRKGWAARILKARMLNANPSARIAVLGLAYKQDTHSTKNSPSLALLSDLEGREVVVHDPVVPASAAPIPVDAADGPLAAVTGADALCIMTPWSPYKALDPKAVAAAMRGRLVLDPYRVLDEKQALAAGLDYVTLGVTRS
ncbi:UDP binding domain-containing protein [Thalassobaculum sp. OXR-137]|uniref:UDP binding domain-containing protein n=1 Tax=Thalassobaculum sp. OXR-137 TaxID=3100173 RepID=UPI002AC8BC59|nr:UDP binding domain-containing protein [Thalassobaculum sp. OXR-137]WPZ36210.1 UDP binding domain-containing protein [Thalassobaculum sp. OXR-137]